MTSEGGVAAGSVVVLQPAVQGGGALVVGQPGGGVGPFGLQGAVEPLGLAVGPGPAGLDEPAGDPTGESFGFSGEFLEVEAPSRLVCTEAYEAAPSMTADVPDGPPAVITLTLEEADGRTTLTLLMRYPSREVREAVLASGMTGGFDTALTQLEDLLTSG